MTIDWTKASAELTRKLDPAFVVKPTGNFGPKGDYLEGWHVINEANRIFGFNGWSYTIDLRQDALVEGKDGKGNPQWQAAYTCVCTLHVDGVTRQDVGFGSGFAKAIGDAIEGATKEAVTDALKRALRTFGNPFGLALYDKSRENVGIDAPPFDAEGCLQRLLGAIAKRTTKQQLTELWSAEADARIALKSADQGRYDKFYEAFKDAGAKALDDPALQAPPINQEQAA